MLYSIEATVPYRRVIATATRIDAARNIARKWAAIYCPVKIIREDEPGILAGVPVETVTPETEA